MNRRTCLAALTLLTGCTSARRGSGTTDIRRRARREGLVEVNQLVPGISIDLRYATADNITGRPLYPANMPCLLRHSTAGRLALAQNHLREQGYGLRIWDAWRPPEAHQRLHDHGKRTGLFIDPGGGWSRHCAGISVDATLVDAAGREQRMPTRFDENLTAAASNAHHPDPVVRRNLRLLHDAMLSAGFKPLPGEWWHFDDLEFLYTSIPVIWGRDLGVRLLD
jgi:D-alanyl-D-alanine dipeptidase